MGSGEDYDLVKRTCLDIKTQHRNFILLRFCNF